MKNFSGVCQAAGADKPLRAFFIWITNIVTLPLYCTLKETPQGLDMIKNLIFDFGKVLICYDYPSFLRTLFDDDSERLEFEKIFCSLEFTQRCDLGVEPFINLPYVKIVKGIVDKRDKNPFAFLKTGKESIFLSPSIVGRYHLSGNETVTAAAVYDFNKKKSEWNWTCISIKQ